MDKKYVIQCAVRGYTTKKNQNESVPIHQLFQFLNEKYIYVRFYLLYHFPNFRNKISCTLDTNMCKPKSNKIC